MTAPGDAMHSMTSPSTRSPLFARPGHPAWGGVAEGVGFEPTEAGLTTSPAFEAGPFNRSGTPPRQKPLESLSAFE